MNPYVPQPRQQAFHNANATEILYGGQAGGGKSYCLRWDAIDFCLHLPGFFAAVFRKTLPMLEENHISFIREELSRLKEFYNCYIGKYNETRKRVEFANGSVMRFKHLEYEKDAHDIQGWEIHGAYVDEAAQMSPYLLGYIKSRIRTGQKKRIWEAMARHDPKLWSFVERVPRYAMGSNPGGESHHWLKEQFIDPAPAETMFTVRTKRGNEKTRIFIPASMHDNEYLDENYEDQFENLPEWQQKQLRDGDWNVVPGAFFDCWSPENVIKPFAVPDHWPRIWSCDWGFATPFWIGEFVVSDGRPVKDKEGNDVVYPPECLILVWEWYGRESGNKGIRMDASLVASELSGRGQPEIAVADESMWNHHDSGPSPAEKFANNGVFFARADRDRVLGWQEMYSRIKNNMFCAFDTCREAIRTIPTVQHDDKKQEDVEKKGEDHPPDGIRYACMARPFKREKAEPKPPWWEDTGVPTFNQIMKSREKTGSWRPDII